MHRKRYLLVFILIWSSLLLKGQEPIIEFSLPDLLRINELESPKGALSLREISQVLNDTYRKKRLRGRQVPYYLYRFKRIKITLESVSDAYASDNCRALLLEFEGRRKFNGKLIINGVPISHNSTYAELSQSPQILPFIDGEISRKNIFLQLRFKGHIVSIAFTNQGTKINDLSINSF